MFFEFFVVYSFRKSEIGPKINGRKRPKDLALNHTKNYVGYSTHYL